MTHQPPGRFTRRRGLALALASAAAATGVGRVLAGQRPAPKEQTMSATGHRMPSLFLAHGAPMLLDMPGWVGELKAWADALPKPEAVLMVSAHWEARPVTLGATTTVPLVYDFYGFPERYYRQQYPAPGAPKLAERVRQLVGATQPVQDARRLEGRGRRRRPRRRHHQEPMTGGLLALVRLRAPPAGSAPYAVETPGTNRVSLLEDGRQASSAVLGRSPRPSPPSASRAPSSETT